MLRLGVLCDLSNVDVEFRSKNFEHYDANAVVLTLLKDKIFKILVDSGKKPLLQHFKFVLKLWFPRKKKPISFSQGSDTKQSTFGKSR